MAKLLMITGLGSARDLASDRRGAFYYTLEEFHKYWDRIDIISPKISGQSSGVKCLFGNVYIHISPWPLILHPFWFLKKGLEIYKEQKFDLMTVHDFPPFYNGIGARLLYWKIKLPYILEIFHVPGYPKSSSIKEIIYLRMAKMFLAIDSSRASAIRVMNSSVGSFLKDCGVPENKIINIPAVYIDSYVFKPINIEKKYDLIFVGRSEKNKGTDLLLDAVKLVADRSLVPIKCLIVGDGPLRFDLEKKVVSYGLKGNIFFYGFAKDKEEIARLLNESKILVMPSFNEGGPRVVVEAMACGVPVLATSVGIVPDLLKNGQGGVIIDWSPIDIASKIEALLTNPEAYNKHIEFAVEKARKFERTEAIKNYANIIKRFI